MQSQSRLLSRFLTGVTIGGMLIAVAAVPPALAQDADPPAPAQEGEPPEITPEGETIPQEEAEEGVVEEIVVKGFRYSLEQAVDLRRDAVNVRDSIVTEDIGKMPDLNLAEALQRVPGVAIVRQGGEGRQMSLRGLGANFTRVTLNGMEVPASTSGLDSSGGVNRGRAFDFNVFPAELFHRIDINKSNVSSIEEGGIAGTVEMFTLRPLDRPGLTATLAAEGGYNDLSDESDPRVTGTLSVTNEANSIGFLLSGAYIGRTAFQDGFGTVRWAQPDRDFAGNNTNLSDDELHDLWYPRLPRPDSFHTFQDRYGFASALQFRPSERFEFGVNYLHSRFKQTTDSYNSFGEFRRSGPWGYPAITPNDVTVATDGTGRYAVAGNFDGVGLRTESRQTWDDTKFNQLTADFRYDMSDSLMLTGMVGYAQSNYLGNYFRVNIETPDPANLTYDFRGDPNFASVRYNIDVTDPANFIILDNDRLERNNVDRRNYTGRLDLQWALGSSGDHVVNIGGIYNDREVESIVARQAASPPGNLPGISKVYNYVDNPPFLVLDFEPAKGAYGYGDAFTPYRGPGRATWVVKEKTAGVYGEYNLSAERFRANLGLRWVHTKTEPTGWVTSDISNTEENSYSNLLPAVNLAFDATEDLVLRAAVGRSLTRPSLSNLAPAKTYSDVNFTVGGSNSQLDPLKSDNLDLSAEWYFAPQSVLAATFFYKDIKSFIAQDRTEEPLRPIDYPAVRNVYPEQPELLDPSLIWTYQILTNVDGTNLKGFELAYQQPFTFLPGWASNFGFVGNYSYVDAVTETTRNDQIVEVPLTGLSRHSYNLTLYYETSRWGLRLAVNERADYVTNNQGRNGNVSEDTTGPVRWDMRAFLHINDMFSISFEGINLTDEPERLFTTGNGTMDLVREFNYAGRQLFLGLRATF